MRATTGMQISETLRSRERTGSAICQVSNESYQQPFPYVNIPVIIEGEKTGRTFRRLHYFACLFSQWREHRVGSLVSKREHFLFAPTTRLPTSRFSPSSSSLMAWAMMKAKHFIPRFVSVLHHRIRQSLCRRQ